MTIQNTNNAGSNVGAGAPTLSPLGGYEVIDLQAGSVKALTTVHAIADTALVDQTVTATGTNQATAYVVQAHITNITTAAASTGAVLPAATKPGMKRIIFNNGANPITVYGNGSDTIDGVAGATGVTLTNALRCEFYCVASGKWLSAKLGATST